MRGAWGLGELEVESTCEEGGRIGSVVVIFVLVNEGVSGGHGKTGQERGCTREAFMLGRMEDGNLEG